LRWQYVQFPQSFSPSFRLLTGVQKIKDPDRDHFHFTYGLGVGWTTTLHKNLDMKIETRVGQGSEPWSMVFLSFNLKVDDWVEDISSKVKKLGEDTWEVSGKIIRGTVNAPADVVQWLRQTEEKREPKLLDYVEEPRPALYPVHDKN